MNFFADIAAWWDSIATWWTTQAHVIIGRLLESSQLNLEIFFITLLLGLPLGLIISFGSMSRFTPLRWLTQTFVWIIRGTPLMLQIIIVFYGPGLIWGGKAMGRMEAALLAFVINYACYFSEIFRGGIQSMPAGQKEAGEVLGMTKTQIFFKITLLQVIKRIVPPLGNEFIILLKDTSLITVIGGKELVYAAQAIYGRTYEQMFPLIGIACVYLVLVIIFSYLVGLLERRLRQSDRR